MLPWCEVYHSEMRLKKVEIASKWMRTHGRLKGVGSTVSALAFNSAIIFSRGPEFLGGYIWLTQPICGAGNLRKEEGTFQAFHCHWYSIEDHASMWLTKNRLIWWQANGHIHTFRRTFQAWIECQHVFIAGNEKEEMRRSPKTCVVNSFLKKINRQNFAHSFPKWETEKKRNARECCRKYSWDFAWLELFEVGEISMRHGSAASRRKINGGHAECHKAPEASPLKSALACYLKSRRWISKLQIRPIFWGVPSYIRRHAAILGWKRTWWAKKGKTQICSKLFNKYKSYSVMVTFPYALCNHLAQKIVQI